MTAVTEKSTPPSNPKPLVESAPHVLDRVMGPVMFWWTMAFLAINAILFHLSGTDLTGQIPLYCLIMGGLLYLLFPIELIVHWVIGNRICSQHKWSLLIPWLRMGAKDHTYGTLIWLPRQGWKSVGRELERHLRHLFAGPMMLITLSVLPLVLFEYIYSETIATNPTWKQTVEGATAIIWMAFVIEFVLMISVVEKKWSYVGKNWIDVVVILLPMVMLLRTVRVARLIRLNQMARTIQLYRVRGLALRAWRAFLALELIERIFWRDPVIRLERLEQLLDEKRYETSILEAKIEALKKHLAEQEKEDNENAAA